ncbi:MucBP domain-containing protein [Lactococcus petauri]|uniref:MucBP domain-containing protein n=1 Tax=Lactococcus petauri TaxID=1940789 RepID=UPI00254A400E|nr:MucBP domain-containing protein [Lactococcus petauri]
MKKLTHAIALSTIVLGAISPTLQVIAETPKVEETQEVTPEALPENVEVQASSSDIAAGTFGTAPWRIDSSGVLHIGAGTFSDTPVNQNGARLSPWYQWSKQITSIRFEGDVVAGNILSNLFDYLTNVTSIEGIERLNTSHTTEMQRVFGGCASLTSLDLTSWDVSNVTTIFSFLNGATNMESLNVSNWNVSNMIAITYAFSEMPKLKELDLSQWRLTPLYSAQGVFMGDSSLEALDLSGFDMTQLEKSWITGYEMSRFFQNTTSLKVLKLSDKFRFWVTDSVNVELPEISANNQYTGKWQNVGTGSLSHPQGADVWTSKQLTQNFNSNAKSDTYVWQPYTIAAGNVTVKYVDTEGTPIAEDVIKSGNIGETYTTEQKDIPGYTFKEVQGNPSGKFTDQPQTVTYVYEQHKDKSTVIVHDSELTVGDTWKSEDNFDSATDYYGNAVPFSDINVEGQVDTTKAGTYKVTYTRFVPNFFSNSENQGTYSAVATITVKEAQPVKGGDITVKFVDIEGNKISDDVIKAGNIGEAYTTEQKNILGYTFKEVQGDASGKFTDQAQTVTYVYTKNELPHVTGTILVQYVDTNGQSISEDVVKSGIVGEGYSTEKKDIKGYTFKEVRGNAAGHYTDQVQTVSYIYTKNKTISQATETPKGGENDQVASAKQKFLPKAGENENMTLINFILGLTFLVLALFGLTLRIKKINK